MSSQTLANPYVGPRSFLPGEPLYGRDRELRDLFGLLVAERIVLLHSPSGAGKTSLIQAALIPRLLEADFTVLPVVRVGLEPPAEALAAAAAPAAVAAAALSPAPAARRAYERDRGGPARLARPAVANRYTLSTLIALTAEHAVGAQGDPHGHSLALPDLAGMTLAAYLDAHDSAHGKVDTVLIFDQFEEVLTVDPLNVAAKHEFFAQLGEALRDRRRWALFAMREDYVASLAPYLRPLPTRLANTFRLDLLDVPGALAAIREPAERSGADFTREAAGALVDDLRKAQVQLADGTIVEQLGPGIEPVQLQVVCYRLWQRLFGPGAPPQSAGPAQIRPDDLQGVADVDGSLAEYYAERVAAAAAEAAVSERAVREWVDRKLITPLNIRSQVLRGASESEGLPNAAIAPLINAYLVRVEQRRGMGWLELAHDRLVGPVRANNAAWFAANLSPLQRQADLWERQGRPRSLLFREADLAAAEAWAAAHPAELGGVEQAFLADSRELQASVERERRQARRIRRLAFVATGVAAIALVALVLAVRSYLNAAQQQRISKARELAAAARAALDSDPELSALLAIRAADATNPEDPQVFEAADVLQIALNSSRIRGRISLPEIPAFVDRTPDGSGLIVARIDGAVTLYDLAGGTEPRGLLTLPAGAWRARYSQDGRALASADFAGQAQLWDAESGQPLGDPFAHELLSDLALSPDGRQLATAGGDGLARAWDVATRSAREFNHGGYLYGVAFAQGGRTLVTAGDDGRVLAWDIASGRVIQEDSFPNAIFALAASPDGSTIAAGSSDGQIYMASLSRRGPQPILRGHVNSVLGLDFNADGSLLASAGNDGSVRVWSPHTAVELVSLHGHTDAVNAVAFSYDGAQVTSASSDGTVRTWSVAPLHVDELLTVAESPDGARLATSGEDGVVSLWDLAGERPLLRLRVEKEFVHSVAFSRDGAMLAAGGGDRRALVWETAGGRELARIDVGEDIYGLAFAPDGGSLVSASGAGLLTQWELPSGRRLRDFSGFTNAVTTVAVSPDGERLAAADRDGALRVFALADGAEIASLPAGDHGAVDWSRLAFSPDGARLAAVGEAGTALIWAPGGAEAPTMLVGHTNKVSGVAFSADGATLATSGLDRTVRLWRAADGAAFSTFSLPADSYDLLFMRSHPDRLVVAGTDGLVRVIPLQLKGMRELAQSRLTRGLTAEECARYHLEDACAAAP